MLHRLGISRDGVQDLAILTTIRLAGLASHSQCHLPTMAVAFGKALVIVQKYFRKEGENANQRLNTQLATLQLDLGSR